jgi:2-keto-4-pentenoate hydratase/2-oxohepta-3-ene-1,7-dioic acid hydratase in catechol pathway
MKIATHRGRAVIVTGDASAPSVVDIATASAGRFGPDPMDVFTRWDEFIAVAADLAGSGPAEALVEADLGNPVPMPRQVFAIGLNYMLHVEETGSKVPEVPATFTKFPASLTGPFDDVELGSGSVDWEIELVVVIGRRADRVAEDDAWSHIAGYTVGQDISDRHLQFAAGSQFSLGKSGRTYGPVGPWVVTLDEFADPNDLGLRCSLDGEIVQDSRTSDLIFSVPRLIAELSAVLPLLPGDIIFTGTPSGVGIGRKPPRFLRSGEVIESWIEGIGTIRNRCR